MFSQKLKLTLLFSCLFIFLFLISTPTAEAAVCPPDGCYCWCKCPDSSCSLYQEWGALSEPESSGRTNCNNYCSEIGGSAIHYDGSTSDLPSQCTGGQRTTPSCEVTEAPPTPPTPPTEPVKEAPAEPRAAPTCVPGKDCEARWQEAKKGILSNITLMCYCCGDCGLNDIVNVFVGASNYIFGVVGALALLFFIYGGVLWLTAGGKSEQIEKGKKALTSAIVGLAIVFGAWLIVQFAMTALGVESVFFEMFRATK